MFEPFLVARMIDLCSCVSLCPFEVHFGGEGVEDDLVVASSFLLLFLFTTFPSGVRTGGLRVVFPPLLLETFLSDTRDMRV